MGTAPDRAAGSELRGNERRDACGGAGAEVVDVVTHGREVAHQKFFHFVAGVIAGDTYFSHRIFVFVLFLGSVIQR